MKAHSARVRGKNFRNFAGKPLFRWILDTLLSVEEIEKIIINTDARQILKENGVMDSDRVLIRDRKPEICGDHVSMNLVIDDDLAAIDSRTFVMTHTTNPLLTAVTIREAIEAYQLGIREKGKDSLFTVNEYQTRFYREDGSAVNHDPNDLLPTQELEPWYEENSNLYIFTKESFKKTNARIGANPILFPTPTLESADIDNATQWRIAEIIALAEMLVQTANPPS
ncbi:MAG: acylneuraminate cytidylyltransferase [Opitutaceae bacterium]|nr:acylneuraminate cytidylyltransferase [Opitutaceae bacterium]